MTATRKEGLRLDVLERDDEGRLLVSVLNVRTGEKLEGFLFRQVQEPNDGSEGLLLAGCWGSPKGETITLLPKPIPFETVGDPTPRGAHPPSSEPDPDSDSLLGSSILESNLLIGDSLIQLGELVTLVHGESGLSVSQWNALADAEREDRLAVKLAAMRGEAEVQKELELAEDKEAEKLKAEREAFEAEKAEFAKEKALKERSDLEEARIMASAGAPELKSTAPGTEVEVELEKGPEPDSGEPEADGDPGAPETETSS